MRSNMRLMYTAAAVVSPLFVAAAPLRVLPRQTAQKFVVAHHIVGNDASYTVDTWASDISLASANGIDGFALNVGNDPFTTTQVSNAFQAAANQGNFSLFFSFDMSSFPCTAASDAQALISLTQNFSTNANYFQFDGAPYVSTFAGESCTFGQTGDVTTDDAALNAAWETYVGGVDSAIHFAPAFFIDPSRFANLPVTNGGFNFNGGFTNTINDQSDPALIATAQNDSTNALTSDAAFTAGLAGKSYMTGVSPVFFTHFSPQTFNKNFVFLMEDSVFAGRWEQLATTLRDSVDIVQVVTWNDYGESHYVGPNDGDFPTGSEAWVDGFDHTGLLNVVSHFSSFFKTGTEPTIANDLIVLQGRPNPHNAQSSDPVGIPTTADLLEDNFYATIFATAPAQVTLTAASGDSATQNVPAGVSRLSHPLAVGSGMSATISRNNATVATATANGTFIFDANPALFNFNAFIATSQ